MVEGRNIEVRLKNAPREPSGGPRGPPGGGMGGMGGPPPPRGEEGAKLYVAHLPMTMGDDQLAGLFQAYGRVLESKVRLCWLYPFSLLLRRKSCLQLRDGVACTKACVAYDTGRQWPDSRHVALCCIRNDSAVCSCAAPLHF